MKQNVTVAVDKQLLKKARLLAAQKGTSISAILAGELQKVVLRESAYEQAKTRALAYLSSPFRLGGGKLTDREALHDRQNLR